MSRDNRDKRGGHTMRDKYMHSCGCCSVLSKDYQSPTRAKRNRASARHERRADG